MTLRLYNTMTRRVEDFVPIAAPRVTLYSCGPTVYNYAHIGNFRSFLTADLLRRWLEASGYQVFHIMNLTDVDDKIIRAASERGVSIDGLVTPFIQAFYEDRDYLRLVPAHAYPRATHWIPAMVKMVARLLEIGVAYRTEEGSVYFGIERFPGYGRLSRLDTRELKTGASQRVAADEYGKDNAQDFVIWKAAKDEDEKVGAAWDAPFGRGRPGWHLECSAMALGLLEERFGIDVLDIHTGGVDLIFPHHEDEIAQSCAYTGKPDFARVWIHGEFLNIRGTKMSKRFGNITTPRDLREDGIEPAAIRLMMYQTHYRQQFDLTDEGIAAAREGARRLGEFADRLDRSPPPKGKGPTPWDEVSTKLESEIRASLDDDLNAPAAVAAGFDFVREANRLLDQGLAPSASARSAWDLFERTLAVSHRAEGRAEIAATATDDGDPPGELPPEEKPQRLGWAVRWANRRSASKRQKDFAASDRIRALLAEHGFEVRDRRDGSAELIDRG